MWIRTARPNEHNEHILIMADACIRWEVVAKVVGADPYSDVAVLKAERAAASHI